MNVCTLVPDYVKDKHPRITSLAVGIMFAAYQLLILILAPILGEKLSVLGRRSALLYGFVVLSLATVSFAMASFCETDEGFYTVSIVARAFQGAADAIILVTVPSIIAIEWPDRNETYQSYAGAAMGLGLMLGPVIASGFQQYFDFFWTMIFFAIIVTIFGLIVACLIPKRIDEIAEDQDEFEDVPFTIFLKNPRVLAVLFALFAASIGLISQEPILVLRLQELGVSR